MQLIYCINIKEELEIFKGFPLVMRKKYRSLSDGTAFRNVLTDPMYVCMYICIYSRCLLFKFTNGFLIIACNLPWSQKYTERYGMLCLHTSAYIINTAYIPAINTEFISTE